MTIELAQQSKRKSAARTLRLTTRRTVERTQVEQRFGRGRSKTVAVEIKRRSPAKGTARQPLIQKAEAPTAAEGAFAEPKVGAAEGSTVHAQPSAPSKLTDAEHGARVRAVETAWKEEWRRQAETDAEEQRPAAEAAEAKRRQEKAEAEVAPVAQQNRQAGAPRPNLAAKRDSVGRGRAKHKKAAKVGRTDERTGLGRRQNRFTVATALDDRLTERPRSLATLERQRAKMRGTPVAAQDKVVRNVLIPDAISVQELAHRMAEPAGRVIQALLQLGEPATIDQKIDADTAELVVREFGHQAKRVHENIEAVLHRDPDAPSDLQPRPPVVTVMGHVDHGKTSILDALRATDVAGGEAGGITQHIGAYQLRLGSDERITFIDTPGHAAFTEMRARGANVTDIVVLVVAADDGVMAQTIEAIRHAQAAEVPMVVAINKVDRPGADPQRVKHELLNHGVVVEELGGETLAVEISARERRNLDRLQEAILLQAELLEIKANPLRRADGVVLEAKLDHRRGPVATLLVQGGTLRQGDALIAGSEWGRVRALVSERGERVDQALPGQPVEVLGLAGTPRAGDGFVVVDDEPRAREIGTFRQRKQREAELLRMTRGTLEQRLSQIKKGETKELPIIVKADVQGSLEAIMGNLQKLQSDDVTLHVLHAGAGGINESDVSLAQANDGMIVAFNVRPTPRARQLAERNGVEIRAYAIIHELVDAVRVALSGLLSPVTHEKLLGHAEIRQVFKITGSGKVAGCMVSDGVVRRGARVRLVRDDVVVYETALGTLRRFKDDVGEVKEGYECGIVLANHQDIQVGDRIECYEVEEIARTLAPAA